MSAPLVLVVMGVSGSGKTTVGSLLAGRLGWPYAEADDFHSDANVAKMARHCRAFHGILTRRSVPFMRIS